MQTYFINTLRPVTHICDLNEHGHPRFRNLLVVYSVPSYFLKQYWCIILIWPRRENWIKCSTFHSRNAFEKILGKMWVIKFWTRWRVDLPKLPLWIAYSLNVLDVLSLTHWGRDKMAAIFQTTFSYVFSWMKMNDIRLNFTEVCS